MKKFIIGFFKLSFILSSFSPLFVLLLVRRVSVPNDFTVCVGEYIYSLNKFLLWIWIVLIVVPNILFLLRFWQEKRKPDKILIPVKNCKDQNENLLVYLFATLMPIYQTQITNIYEFSAMLLAVLLILFLFWHMDLFYMNFILAAFGYRINVIFPDIKKDQMEKPWIILSKKPYLQINSKVYLSNLFGNVYLHIEND